MDNPAICDAAVVGAPTSGLNDLPCAFVTLRPGHTVTQQDICQYVAGNIHSKNMYLYLNYNFLRIWVLK